MTTSEMQRGKGKDYSYEGVPEHLLPQIHRKTITPDNAEQVMRDWINRVTGVEIKTSSVFMAAALPYVGDLPPTIVLLPLYMQPNMYQNSQGATCCSSSLGLGYTDWDPKFSQGMGHWNCLEPPEWPEGKISPLNAFTDGLIVPDAGCTMYWKMHDVFPKGAGTYLALNPIHRVHVKLSLPDEQRCGPMINSLKNRLDNRGPSDIDERLTIDRYLRNAVRGIDGMTSKLLLFRFRDRDKIAIAMGIGAAVERGHDTLAPPSEDTLRERWGKITPTTLKRYKTLAEFAQTNQAGIEIVEFNPDLSLSKL